MNEQMSMLGLILEASLVVQSVMLILIIISIVSWAIIFYKIMAFKVIKIHLNRFKKEYQEDGKKLVELHKKISAKDKNKLSDLEKIFSAGYGEIFRLKELKVEDKATEEGMQLAMRMQLNEILQKFSNYQNFLASAASLSPYIGLFGTVWGIMHAFMGLAQVQQASLNVVAPGIAEALIATAIGLFAAIPAAFFYNRFNQQINNIRKSYLHFMESFSLLAHRAIYAKKS